MGAGTAILRVAAMALAVGATANSADLPTAKSIAAEMGMGWNNGNNLEVPKDPTLWGNALPTQALIDSVKAAGFKTIRLPCAWYSHTQSDSLTIKPEWMAQVKQIVDYCIKDSLFVVLNSHWDMGWLESRIDTTKAVKELVNRRQGAYWRQIATTFKDYDRHLLLASANEPGMQDAYGAAFGADRIAVLNLYHQTFIDTVRATGGNNATRTLILQGPHTDIEVSKANWTTLPTDKVAGRLMAEMHFYPYQFALMEDDADWGKVFWYWGKNNLSTGTDSDRNTTWCGEAFVDSQFTILKRLYVDKGIPVILGEFGAIKRTTLSGDTLKRHIASRRSFYEYVVNSSLSHGIIPIAWDAGNLGDKTMSVFDRKTAKIFDLGLLNAMRAGAGLAKLAGDTALVQVATQSSSMKALYSAKDSLFGQVELGVVKPDFSKYDSILVHAYVNGETTYLENGTTKYGYLSLSLVTMSNNWTWREVSFGTVAMNSWTTYSFGIGTDTTNKKDLVPALATKVDFFALQAYSKGYRGTLYIDWIVFKTKAGATDTLYSFDLTPPGKTGGNVESVSLIPTSQVASDVEWKTATKAWGATSVKGRASNDANALRTTVSNGFIRASYSLPTTQTAQATLTDLKGGTIWSNSVTAGSKSGVLDIPATHGGMAILRIQQGSHVVMDKVYVP